MHYSFIKNWTFYSIETDLECNFYTFKISVSELQASNNMN